MKTNTQKTNWIKEYLKKNKRVTLNFEDTFIYAFSDFCEIKICSSTLLARKILNNLYDEGFLSRERIYMECSDGKYREQYVYEIY